MTKINIPLWIKILVYIKGHEHEKNTVRSIANGCNTDAGYMAILIKELEQSKLLNITQDKKHMRRNIYKLTEIGEKLAVASIPIMKFFSIKDKE